MGREEEEEEERSVFSHAGIKVNPCFEPRRYFYARLPARRSRDESRSSPLDRSAKTQRGLARMETRQYAGRLSARIIDPPDAPDARPEAAAEHGRGVGFHAARLYYYCGMRRCASASGRARAAPERLAVGRRIPRERAF